MHAYASLCLATGIRTEEAQELRWDHVDFGDPSARPPVPASAAVWRSVRADGDTQDGEIAQDARSPPSVKPTTAAQNRPATWAIQTLSGTVEYSCQPCHQDVRQKPSDGCE